MFVLIESRTSEPFEALEYLHGTAFDTKEEAVEAMRWRAITYVHACAICSHRSDFDALDYIEFGELRGVPYASVVEGWEWRVIEVDTNKKDQEG